MVNYSASLDATFSALADPVRRAVLARLVRGPAAVSELAADHRMSLPAFLKHVGVLERARLVETRKVGRVRHCRLVPRPLLEAEAWIEHHRLFWERQLDSLDRFLDSDPLKESAPWPPRSKNPPPPSSSGARSARRKSGSSRRGPRRKR